MTTVRIKRVYEKPEKTDGLRILVDRIWPRGLSKEKAALDDWARDVAPSTALRKWFGHEPERFAEFRRRYRAELSGGEPLKQLRAQLRKAGKATLLYSAHDEEHNQAVVLAQILKPRRR